MVTLSNVKLDNTGKVLNTLQQLNGNAYWIDALFTIEPGADFGFKIGQQKNSQNEISAETIVGYNSSSGKLYVDKTKSGGGKLNPKRLLLTAETGNAGKTIRLQILFDKSSLEVFSNDGEKVITTYIFPDNNAHGLSAFAKNGNTIIQSLKIWDLSGVQEK